MKEKLTKEKIEDWKTLSDGIQDLVTDWMKWLLIFIASVGSIVISVQNIAQGEFNNSDNKIEISE